MKEEMNIEEGNNDGGKKGRTKKRPKEEGRKAQMNNGRTARLVEP